MLHNYDEYPEFYYKEQEEYSSCLTPDEARVLRMVKTYNDFVNQRYTAQPNGGLVYDSYKPNRRGKCLRNSTHHADLLKIAEQLHDYDPAHLISYIFELWPNRDHYPALVFHKLDTKYGVAYPSWSFIISNSSTFLHDFKRMGGFKPKGFIPLDDIGQNYKDAMQSKVDRYCAAWDKTPEEYWLEGKHLFPPHLHARDVAYCDSLHEAARAVKKKFGFTIKELTEFLEQLEQAQDLAREQRYNELCAKERRGEPLDYKHVVSLPREEICSDDLLDKLEYIEREQSKGRDISTRSFEEEVDKKFNRPDVTNPEVVLDLLFGPPNE